MGSLYLKRIGEFVAWGVSRIVKTLGNIVAFVVRVGVPVKPGLVVCWAHNYKQYGCNPRYLTEYLLEHYPQMRIVWVFRKGIPTGSVPDSVRCVRFRSLEYIRVMAEAEFLVSNLRTDPWHAYWHKRTGQKYLQLWHGAVAMKKVERDAQDSLGFSYLQKAKADSEIADLMVSGSKVQTELLSTKFWYDGEILECGVPRNDIFFDELKRSKIRQRILQKYSVPASHKVVLYAPTFRRGGSSELYHIDWEKLMPAMRRMLGGEVTVMLRLHPNLLNKLDSGAFVSCPNVVDVTRHDDIHELLCVADMLITDYSSSMFDYSLQYKPCMLYVPDVDSYDRGFYFDLSDLPFPSALTVGELARQMLTFDKTDYARRLHTFLNQRIGNCERGEACREIARWMKGKQSCT